MKRLILEEMLLLSLKEKRARRVKFDPRRTIVLGSNQTGKSCLIKSIYRTFGAELPKVPESWDAAEVTSFIRFHIAGRRHMILRHSNVYAIYDESNKLLKVCKSISQELSPYFTELFDFKIKLPDQKRNIVIPPPAYLFLPFYIDQDKGWSNNWSSFERLYLPNTRQAMVNYHTGIRPNEWYEAKGEMEKIRSEIKNIEEERSMLKNIMSSLREELSSVQFDTDIEAFKEEIARLLAECEELNTKQEKMKAVLVKLYNYKITLETQIKITQKALSESRKDYHYIVEQLLEEHVECPICGAEYDNAFADQFAVAQDEGECHALLDRLQKEIAAVDDKIKAENGTYTNGLQEVAKIRALLEKKQGQVTLNDLIESRGKNRVRDIVQGKIDHAKAKIYDSSTHLEELQEQLKKYENRERTQNIRGRYSDFMKKYAMDLGTFELNEKIYNDISSRISVSGSTSPRALLAYFFSILQLVNDYSSTTFCPIIIDTPNQQGQDRINLPRMLNFVKDNQPEDSQLVLALESTEGIDFGGKVEELTTKYRALQEEEYESVFNDLKPFINAMVNYNTVRKLLF